MQSTGCVILMAACLPVLVSPAGSVQAHKRSAAKPISEISHAVVGRICATPSGALFDFGRNGDYRYVGLWESDGHYRIEAGSIQVALHSGLVRSFVVSFRSGVLMLEDTVVTYTSSPPRRH
ncbi:MAG: hypothetical protein AB7S59_09170 [Parvibaculaceae bacterium]